MAGMNPAFIAAQLGHSVQVLLSTCARWINSPNDRAELDKLKALEVVHKWYERKASNAMSAETQRVYVTCAD